jgi:hypothetical protein
LNSVRNLPTLATLALAAAFALAACSLLVDSGGVAGASTAPTELPDSGAPDVEVAGDVVPVGPDDSATAADVPKVGGPQVIASGLHVPVGLGLTPTDVIVATRTDAAAWRVTKTGGSVPVVVDSLNRVGAGPMSVLVDGTSVYWTGIGDTDCCGRLRRAFWVEDAGHSDQVDYVGGSFIAIEQDPAFVYAAAPPGEIRVYRKSDLQPLATRSVSVGGAIAVDATHVYYVTPANEIRRLDRGNIQSDAGADESFATNPTLPAGMVIDEAYVYWTLDLSGTVLRLAKESPGGTPTVIASGIGSPSKIVLYGEFAYWTNAVTRAIERAPKAGGAVETVAAAQDNPSAIAVDDSGVYWTNLTAGTLLRAPFVSN